MALALVTAISSVASAWLKGRQEVAKKKQELKIADLENKAQLLKSKEQYNHDWEIRSLMSNPMGLRILSFTIFSLPIIITVVVPAYGADIWSNLEIVPDWFKTVYLSMVGGIWGISELKQMGFIKK